RCAICANFCLSLSLYSVAVCCARSGENVHVNAHISAINRANTEARFIVPPVILREKICIAESAASSTLGTAMEKGYHGTNPARRDCQVSCSDCTMTRTIAFRYHHARRCI